LLVWSICAVVCIALLTQRAVGVKYIGLAQAPNYEVSSATTGTIDAVVVSLFDDVQAGEVVATLDERSVVASIGTINARIAKLEAELEATRAEIGSGSGSGLADINSDLRRFQINEEDRRLAALRLGVVIESDEVELTRLKLELGRNSQLLEEGIIGQSFFDLVKASHDVVETRLTSNKVLLEQTRQEFRKASERRLAYESELAVVPAIEPLLQPLLEAISVEIARLEEIQVLRESLVLRSPVDGRISSVVGHRGQAILPGEPIVTVSERTIEAVVAYLSSEDGVDVSAQQTVRLVSLDRPGMMADSVVLRVSPGTDIIPQRLWSNPNVAVYGRAVVIAPQPSMGLTPGELVEVRFKSR
jgi:multidrug resistance efflux pump